MLNFAIEDLKPETSLCSLKIEGSVAHLTLTREDVYNALNITLISEIISILDWRSRRLTTNRPGARRQPQLVTDRDGTARPQSLCCSD